MSRQPTTDEERARAITLLADGTAPAGERAALEAWAAQHPDVLAAVERERRVAQLFATEGPAAPDRLVRSVQTSLDARSSGGPRRAARRSGVGTGRGDARRAWRWSSWSAGTWSPGRLGLAGGIAVAAAAVIAAIVIAVNPGSTAADRPTITAAAEIAYRPATQGPPATAGARLLDVSYAGITYPDYTVQFGVPATGERTDRIGGRATLTVFYRLRGGVRMSYTIFSGAPVPRPAAARAVVFEGVPLHVYTTSSGLTVVTLVRKGRTCVLAARTSHAAVLAMAAWPVLAQAS